jgi:uncharacterized membrane protein YgdD (TMEM256/DUF423 family)
MSFENAPRLWIALGALYGFMSVACGAFGAHALQSRLDQRLFQIWQTAAQYQMSHALALVLYGVWTMNQSGPISALPGISFAIGVLIFSGTLYLLALTDIRWLGAITPIGGTFFLIGWLSWAWLAFRHSTG